jgi:PIN domain nuclease of toxin-antitoxin system
MGPRGSPEAAPRAIETPFVIVLDTHVLVWVREGNERLGRRTARRIDRALHDGALAVSAFSFWEIAMLVGAGRMRLRVTVDEFRAATLGAGVLEMPVDGAIAILSTRFGMHGDPADRIILATALQHEASLATADRSLLHLDGGPPLVDASH